MAFCAPDAPPPSCRALEFLPPLTLQRPRRGAFVDAQGPGPEEERWVPGPTRVQAGRPGRSPADQTCGSASHSRRARVRSVPEPRRALAFRVPLRAGVWEHAVGSADASSEFPLSGTRLACWASASSC